MRARIPHVFLALLAFLALAARAPRDPLRVVCTIPDLADLVQTIGGDRVAVTTLCKGTENVHLVTAKPSHLVAMSRADAFVQVGLSLESAFVPGLLQACRNERIQAGRPGFVNASTGWTALDVPAKVDRREGDVHPQGNPHLNLAPAGGRHMAERVLAGLCAVEPASKDEFTRRHAAWLAKLAEAEARWSALAAAWKGRRIVVYHQEFDYLAAASGLEVLGAIEPRPGIEPTPAHLAKLVELLRREKDAVIVTATWSNDRFVRDLAERTGARVAELPSLCRAAPGTETWIGLMDVVHERLDRAFRPAAAKPPEPGR